MVLDECVPYPSPYEYVKSSASLDHPLARRCWTPGKTGRAVFGIVRAHLSDLREESAKALLENGLPGICSGGLSGR